nr:S-layer homology domain-containing protein [uncultured Tyzzerella sp.]
MKKNLSSQAIKAMAIGMAVMLGSTTAISGVVKGSVVEAYAADDSMSPSTITNGNYSVDTTNKYAIVNSGLLFEITQEDSTPNDSGSTKGKVSLVGKLDVVPTEGDADGTTSAKAYGASLQNGILTITANSNTYEFTVDKIDNKGDEGSINKLTGELDASVLNNALTEVITIDGSTTGLAGITINGDLELPALTTLTSTPLKNLTIKGSLTVKDGLNIAAEEFSGAKINSLDLSKAGTIDATAFKGVTIVEELKVKDNFTGAANSFDGAKIGTLILPAGYTGGANDFNNATITNLDLSAVSGNLADSTFASSTIETLKLPVSYAGKDSAFDGSTITSLDLSNVTGNIVKETFKNSTITNLTHNGTAIVGSDTTGATITNLTFKSGITDIETDAFKNATIPNEVTLTGIKTIKSNAFSIANAGATGADTAVTIKMPDLDTTVTEGDVQTKLPANSFGGAGGKHIKLVLPSGVSDEVVTALNQSGTKKFDNENVVVLKEVVVLPQAVDGTITNDEPTKIKFTLDSELSAALSDSDKSDFKLIVSGGSVTDHQITNVSGGDSTTSNVVTITLDKPIEYGQTVTLTYNGNKINIAGIQITNNVAPSVNQTIQVTDANGKYTFEVTSSDVDKTVTLSGFEKVGSKGRARRDVSRAVTFNAGKVTIGSEEYKLTKIGNGKAALVNITDEALKGHTENVTEIADKAFEGNKSVNTLSFPQVTKVGASAFANSSVKSVDLGSSVDSKTTVNIPSDAFKGASNVTSIKTNENSSSKNNAISAANGSSSSNVTVSSGSSSTEVKPGGGSGSGSGGSGSSGSSSSGSGANIGTSVDNSNANNNNNQNQNNNNNNNVTTPVVEDKQLSLDVISLPSVEGEAKAFGDISADYWAKSYIDKLSTAGIINGINGNFQPNGQTKRADVTIMLVKLLGLAPQNNNKFTDVNANAYYAPYVGAASTYGIVNGSNGMFNPEGIISRQDTMVMIGQILKSLNLNVNTDATSLSKFSDLSKVAPYAQESVAILVNSGIITGNNGKLNPTAPVTRAEMATIMSKLYDVLASANK